MCFHKFVTISVHSVNSDDSNLDKMPRHKPPSGAKRVYTPEEKAAILKMYDENFNVKNVAEQYHMPVQTLRDWIEARRIGKIIRLGSGSDPALPFYVERDLKNLICTLADWGRPIDRNGIRDFVEKFCRETNFYVPRFNDGYRPGLDWVRNYENRWSDWFANRKREGLAYARAAGLTEDNVEKFYGLFKELNDKYNFTPENMWNGDESGFSGAKAKGWVYVNKDQRHAYDQQMGNTRAMTTVLFAVNAAGEWIPPFILYKAQHLYHQWTLGGPVGAFYGVNKSGWMEDRDFENWFLKVFLPMSDKGTGQPRLLMFDGHNSHLSYKVAKAAYDANVSLLCLPPHCSHALQPLDVSCFKSGKDIWSEVCKKFYKGNLERNLRKEDFPSMIKVVYEHFVAHPELGVNGFRKCGFRPFNPHAVDDKIVGRERDLRQEVVENPEEVDHLFQIREFMKQFVKDHMLPTPAPPATRRRKVQCVTGEILTSPESLERLLKEDEEKAAKASRGRGRGRGRGAAAPPEKGTGPMDRYMRPRASSSGALAYPGGLDPSAGEAAGPQETPRSSRSQPTPSSVASGGRAYKRGCTADKIRATRAKRARSRCRRSSTSEEDVDDPPAGAPGPRGSSVSYSDAAELLRTVKANSHIVFSKEGVFFPAMVVKVFKSQYSIKKMAPIHKFSGPPHWRYEDGLKICKPTQVKHVIPTPLKAPGSSTRGEPNEFMVPKMEELGWAGPETC